ncbi:MAG: hypothetical protein HYR70_06270 [Chloroflexi bacterium]|nr:hypothetical protein [Chloroflexota bacterium]MBI3338840.1 hypothetical protein [Chloroflexota bacterium]
MSNIQSSTKKHRTGKLVINIGGVPAILAGGLLLISGLYLSLSSLTIRSDNSWIDRAGFGATLGIVALIPGVVMLGLWYLSRIGPRNTTMTLLGASLNLLIGLAGVIPLVNGSFGTNLLAWLLTVISPVFFMTGLSSFLGWWLRDMFSSKQGE